MITAQLWHWGASLGLLEDCDDLVVTEFRCFIAKSPVFRLRENSTFDFCYFSGGLPCSMY